MFDSLMTLAQDASQNTSVSYTADIMGIAAIVGMWKMLEKAGEPGWAALIPFYNMYKFCGVVMGQPWYWVRFLVFIIPIVGWIAGIYFTWQMCKATFGGWVISFRLLYSHKLKTIVIFPALVILHNSEGYF